MVSILRTYTKIKNKKYLVVTIQTAWKVSRISSILWFYQNEIQRSSKDTGVAVVPEHLC